MKNEKECITCFWNHSCYFQGHSLKEFKCEYFRTIDQKLNRTSDKTIEEMNAIEAVMKNYPTLAVEILHSAMTFLRADKEIHSTPCSFMDAINYGINDWIK